MAVAGTHGKSTTSGWLVHVLAAAGADPGAFVGALLPAADHGHRRRRRPPGAGAGVAFVVEADEYAGNFDPYRPDVIVLTSAEWDHPDVFADGDGGDRGVRGLDPPRAGEGRAGRRPPGRARRERGRRRASRRSWRACGLAGLGRGAGGRATARGARSRARGRSGRDSWAGIVAAEPGRRRSLTVVGLADGEPRTRSACRPRAATTPSNALGVIGRVPRGRLAPEAVARRPRDVPRRRAAPGAQGRGARRRRLRRLRPPSHGHPRDARRRPPARARPPGLGRLRAADLPPHRGAARRVRRGPRGRGRRRHRRHLGRARPGHDDRLARPGLADAVARAHPAITVGGPGLRRGDRRAGSRRRSATGDAVLVMGGGRSYRIGELLLEHLEARMTITYAQGHDLLEAPRRAPASAYDGDALHRRCSPRRRRSASTRSRRRWPGTTPSGHTCSRRRRPSATSISRSSGTGSSGDAVLAAWHASWNRRADEAKVRQAGFLAAEIGEDGRIVRLKHWTVTREHLAG